MNNSLRLLLLVSLCFAAVAPASPAYADDPATRASRRHFDRGEKLFALGKFDKALEEYEKAFDAKPIPDFLFNIGQCYRNLGDYDQAIFSFKKYLQLEPDAPDRPKVEKLIEDLEDKRARGAGHRYMKKPPEEKQESHPVYTKWWFWTGVAVVGVAGGIGIYAGTRGTPAPTTDLGNIVFGK